MERLSPELLLEIFDLAVHSPDPSYAGFPSRVPTQDDAKPSRYFKLDDTHPSHPPGISAHEANTTSPVHLTHVCPAWRAVALSHGRLWSTVYVTDGRRRSVEEFGAWMEMSGGCGLKIVFRDGREPTANMGEEEEELADEDGDGWYTGFPYYTNRIKEEEREEEEGPDGASESGLEPVPRGEEGEGDKVELETTPLTEEQEGENALSMLKLAVAHRRRWEPFKLKLRRIRLEVQPSQDILWDALSFKFDESCGSGASRGTTERDKDKAKEKEKEKDRLKTFVLDIPYPKTKFDYVYNCWYGQDSHLRNLIVSKFPCLDELQLWDGVRAGFEEYIPYKRITTLTLHNAILPLHNRFLPTSLREFKALRTLSLALSERQDWHQPSGKLLHSITLPSLENLNLVGHCSLCANNILSMLHLPALVDLCVHTNSSRGRGTELQLPTFLNMWSSGSLRRFSLRDEDAVGFEGRYSALLKHRALQGLCELRLGGVITKTVLDLLAPQHGTAAPLLPSLEHVHFEVALSDSTPASCPLTRLALARSDPSHPTLARLAHMRVGFQRKEDWESATSCWNSTEETDSALRNLVDKRFIWVGTGPWTLEREFVVEDFSLIQGWKERARSQW